MSGALSGTRCPWHGTDYRPWACQGCINAQMADAEPAPGAWTPEQGEHYRLEMHRHAEEKAELRQALKAIVHRCLDVPVGAPCFPLARGIGDMAMEALGDDQ